MIKILFFCLLALSITEIKSTQTSSLSLEEEPITLPKSSPVYYPVDHQNWMAAQCSIDFYDQLKSLIQSIRLKKSIYKANEIVIFINLCLVAFLKLISSQHISQSYQFKQKISLMFISTSLFWEFQFGNSFMDNLNNINNIFPFQEKLVYYLVLALNIFIANNLLSLVQTSIEKINILAYVFIFILSELWFVYLIKIACGLLYTASPFFQLRFIFLNKSKLSQSNFKWKWAECYILSICLIFHANRETFLMQITSEFCLALIHFSYPLVFLYILFGMVPLWSIWCRVTCFQIKRFLQNSKGLKEERDCIICLQPMKWYAMVLEVQEIEFAFAECLVRTKCNHIYHVGCLKLWFSTKRACPLDQQAIPL